MKNTYLVRTFIALVLTGVLSACVGEQYDLQGPFASSESLALNATVSEGAVVTRAASVDELKETYIHTLDVFVEHVTNGTGDGTFIKQYHLSAKNEDGIPTSVDNNWVNNLLAPKWRTEGLVMGQYYNIYVATNNTQTKDDKDLTTFNVAALKALVADEVTDGVAVVNEDNNNVTWGETSTSGNIYKLYDENPGSYRALTSEKEFMMDGVIKNWTPDPSTSDQVFKNGDAPLLLNRAAAKFVLNVKFDEDFLKSLTHNKKVEGSTTTWEEKPEAERVTIVGDPAWKFYNFAFGAPVFAPETQGAGVEVHNSDFNIFHNKSFEGDDKNFQIVTYSYPNKWDAANYATAAPSLVISVGYKTGTGETAPTNYHYYRIPLVKSTVTAIERNHIYVINATIATKGSSATEDQDLTEDIQYAVLPWNDQTNSAAIHGEVQSVQHYYFNANPKVYTLRGDGDQSVVINYSKASGTKVNWKLFTYDANGNQTGVVAKDADGATRAWFYDANGKFMTTYGDGNPMVEWPNMGVTIEQSNEGTSGSKGTVTVTSTALTNKGIKYIRLRVYLDETNDQGVSMENEYHEDILIRHFPTDNIQNITGSWSSRHTTGSGMQETTLTTTVLSEAQSWAEQYGVDFVTEEITATDYISSAQYAAHAGEDGYTIVNAQRTTNRNTFRTYVQNEDQRRAANGQNNAVLGEDGYSYWGVNPSASDRYYNDYDYRTWSGWDTYYYRYATIYRARYSHTYTYTQYSLTVEMPGTGQWVDWDRDAGKTYNQANVKFTRGNNFTAKVYDESRSRIYAIEPTRSGNSGARQYTYDIANGYESGDYYVYTTANDWTIAGNMDLTNNHMYVIQISSTSDEYVLGRPYVNQTTHQSQDDVVSPAFMIASQLGAVSVFTGDDAASNAAAHCDSYMEVAKDGSRYTGWRLPTQSEIKVIVGYQEGEINNVTIPSAYQTMIPVLTGERYWCLSGRKVRTSDNQIVTDGNAYLRCVRDLSADEVDRLNGFDKIQEKYR